MEANKILIAIALLTSPDPHLEIDDAAVMHAALAPAIRQVAIKWEIYDPREQPNVLAEAYRFKEDVEDLARRYRELAIAPPIADAVRLPDRENISSMLTANRIYREELTDRLLYDRFNTYEIQSALNETDRLHEIWERAYEAKRKFYYVTVRRRALNELRKLVGHQAYYSGQLPPPVPLWRLPSIN